MTKYRVLTYYILIKPMLTPSVNFLRITLSCRELGLGLQPVGQPLIRGDKSHSFCRVSGDLQNDLITHKQR